MAVPMMGSMSIPTEEQLHDAYARAVRLCDTHRLALRAQPLPHSDAELQWLGRVEITQQAARAALDNFTRAHRLFHGQ